MRLSLGNHLDKRGSSLIEIMAMMAILGMAVTAMFSTVIGGIYFAIDSENRIKAINLAREWAEWVTNIRNTNWLRFSSDQSNCWRIMNYDPNCIGNPIFATGAWNSFWANPESSYVLENKNGAWYLTGNTSGSWLWIDSKWFYYSSGITADDTLCTFDKTTECRSPFTREIRVFLTGSNSDIVTIKATVDWFERREQSVVINTTLTNWKSKF